MDRVLCHENNSLTHNRRENSEHLMDVGEGVETDLTHGFSV